MKREASRWFWTTGMAMALCLTFNALPSFAAERHELGSKLDGPIHAVDEIFGETRIEPLDAFRVAVAVDRNDAFATDDTGVDYYAVFTSRAPMEDVPSFWGQATVDFRDGLLLVGPAGESRLFAFVVSREDVPTRQDLTAEFPGARLETFTEGGSLLLRRAPAGMTLGQLDAMARDVSAAPQPLDFFLKQNENHGDGGGCARSCSMTCIDGSECEITCGTGLCASCSCENGTLTCKCR